LSPGPRVRDDWWRHCWNISILCQYQPWSYGNMHSIRTIRESVLSIPNTGESAISSILGHATGEGWLVAHIKKLWICDSRMRPRISWFVICGL
jgi:hypothetical protein